MNHQQQPVLKTSHSLCDGRAQRMTKIRQSLKDFALISRNKSMVQKRLVMQNESSSQHNSSDGVSLENEDSTIYSPYQHIEIFAQKYDIIAKLGEGSNGVVHRCRKKRSGVEYAVKCFMFDDEHIPQIRNTFMLVKGLTHSKLIKYQALYLDLKKRACWLVMQLFQAPSLEHLSIASQGQLREITHQLLQTINYLHQHAVSHRDIKPENILYDPVTKRLKLIDFGICRKHRRRGIKFEMLTITGTLYYRAPQMFTGGGYNQKVDVWALAIMIYKLIAGTTPFESEYHSHTIHNILNQELHFPPAFDRYSAALRILLTKMLKKDPKQRISALECMRDSWFYLMETQSLRKSSLLEDVNGQDLQSLKSPLIESLDEESYIRNINGDEYHCFDSDDEGKRKGVGLKRVHRSVTMELGVHSLTNFQL